MTFQINRLIFSTLFALTFSIGYANAFDDKEKEELGEIIRQYILENPEVLVEAQQILEQRQQVAQQQQIQSAISSFSDQLFTSGADVIMGNPDGDVTIVEFFDYNCGFCRRAMADVQEIIEIDKNIKIVLKEFPILGPESTEAAQVSIAVTRLAPEKAADFHSILMGSGGRANKQSALDTAQDLDIDLAAIDAEIASDDLMASVGQNYQIAEALGINGTPAFIIGTEAIPGAVGVDQLMARVENMRKCGSTNC